MAGQIQIFLFLQTCLILYSILCDYCLLFAIPADSYTNVVAKQVKIIYSNRTRSGAISKLTSDIHNPIPPLLKSNPHTPLGQRISGRGNLPPLYVSRRRRQAPTEEENDEWDDGNNDQTKSANGISAKNQKHETLPLRFPLKNKSINNDRLGAGEKAIFIKPFEKINFVGDNFCVDTGWLFLK